MCVSLSLIKEARIYNGEKTASSVSGAGGFPGGAVDKNLPATAGDMGLIPGPGRSHMPWSN